MEEKGKGKTEEGCEEGKRESEGKMCGLSTKRQQTFIH